jgi:hypothetical protein
MNRVEQHFLVPKPVLTFLMSAIAVIVLTGVRAEAQCPTTTFISGLKAPVKSVLSQKGNLLVAEAGSGPNTGRVSIIDPDTGLRRTLLDGLPSGFAPPENAPSGPSGLAVRGRTLYLTIAGGDAALNGPLPGSEVPNPNPSSPLLSSVLEVHFSANVEMTTEGFALTAADHFTLKNTGLLELNNGGGDRLTIRLVADFPDVVPAPRPNLPNGVINSNPFGVVVREDALYVVNASLNSVLKVDIQTGAYETLAVFPRLPNTRQPPPPGPPTVEFVPDSIRLFGDQLLVTALTGFPFPPGQAQVRTVDPMTGANAPLITGLTSAIDVLPVKVGGGEAAFLTLEFSTNQVTAPPAPGRVQLFNTPTGPPVVLAHCLITPTSMVLDQKSGDLYITEIFTGRVVKIDAAQFFVRQHYLDFLGREPDSAGWQFWASQITRCGEDEQCAERNRVDVSRAFFYSGEFITSNLLLADGLRGTQTYNEAFVEQCYLRYLQRQPDADGFQFWVDKLNRRIPNVNDGDYNEMILAFLRSMEYQARLQLSQ